MKQVKFIIILVLISLVIGGCSTVKYFTPNNQEFDVDNISNFHISSTNLIVNDLRGGNLDNSKDVIERILFSSYSMFNNNFQNENITIIVDIIEHRAFFTFMTWNAETKLNLRISDENNILNETEIKTKDKTFNTGGYKSAEKVAQRSFEKAINELLNILVNMDL